MTAPDLLAGFISRKEACQSYNRSLRQFARDFDKAKRAGDDKYLSNFKLHTEDGKIYEAADVSQQDIIRLRDDGKNPSWYVRESWMQETWGLRDGSTQQEKLGHSSQEESEPLRDPQPAAATGSEREEFLRQRIGDLEKWNEDLRTQLDQRNERDRETHHLLKDLHQLVQALSGNPPPQSSSVVPVALIEAPVSGPKPVTKVAQKSTPKPKRRSPKPQAKKSSQAATRKKPTSPQRPAASPQTSRLQRWFPTFLPAKSKKK